MVGFNNGDVSLIKLMIYLVITYFINKISNGIVLDSLTKKIPLVYKNCRNYDDLSVRDKLRFDSARVIFSAMLSLFLDIVVGIIFLMI